MPDSPFKVAYINVPMYPSFNETLAKAPHIEVTRIDPEMPEAQIRSILRDCNAYYVKVSHAEMRRPWHVNASLLADMPALRLVTSTGSGYDHIDAQACSRAGVAVVSQAGANAQGVAEHALAMMMSLLKRIPESHAALRAGKVRRPDEYMGRELQGKTVGIIGLGHIGSRTAALLSAFQARTLAFDPYLDEQTCAERKAQKVSFDTLLTHSDLISVHCPLTAQTRGLFGAAQFSQMRAGAIFVNTARGNTYDETALLQSLESGHLSAAGLDVWETEPPPATHPLLSHPRVMASPHTAGVTHESRDRIARMAAHAIMDFVNGKTPHGLVNPQVLTAFPQRFPGFSPTTSPPASEDTQLR